MVDVFGDNFGWSSFNSYTSINPIWFGLFRSCSLFLFFQKETCANFGINYEARTPHTLWLKQWIRSIDRLRLNAITAFRSDFHQYTTFIRLLHANVFTMDWLYLRMVTLCLSSQPMRMLSVSRMLSDLLIRCFLIPSWIRKVCYTVMFKLSNSPPSFSLLMANALCRLRCAWRPRWNPNCACQKSIHENRNRKRNEKRVTKKNFFFALRSLFGALRIRRSD